MTAPTLRPWPVHRHLHRPIGLLLALAMAGCATTVPYVGPGPRRQVERGRPNIVIDTLGNILAWFPKLLFFDSRFDNHAISEHTEAYVVEYLDGHQQTAGETMVRLNQYAPHKDFKRLFKNRKVAWPYRILLGIPAELFETLAPGRLFPWGDYYNPWSDTAHLYSDHPAIALHELGHSYDINRRRHKGTYAAVRIIPFVDLYQEYQASAHAILYLRETNDHQAEISAYRILYPAYGSYIGRYLFLPLGTIVGVIIGHIVGQSEAELRMRQYHETEQAPASPAHRTPSTGSQPSAPSTEPSSPNTMDSDATNQPIPAASHP